MSEDDKRAKEYAARLTRVADKIPISMLEDIQKRMGDWALSGRSMGASYVANLVKNAERMAEMKEAEK